MKTQLEMFQIQSEIAEQEYWKQVDTLIDLETKPASERQIAYQNRRVQKRFNVWFDFEYEIRALEA